MEAPEYFRVIDLLGRDFMEQTYKPSLTAFFKPLDEETLFKIMRENFDVTKDAASGEIFYYTCIPDVTDEDRGIQIKILNVNNGAVHVKFIDYIFGQ
jgi:hypothetical protein